MKTYRIAVLPGDGIGPEVIAQAVRVLEAVGERFDLRFALETFPIGAAAVAVANNPLPPETRAAVLRSDAVLLGAVGDPRLDGAPRELRPEAGLLALRQLLHVYANLRPVADLHRRAAAVAARGAPLRGATRAGRRRAGDHPPRPAAPRRCATRPRGSRVGGDCWPRPPRP